MIKIMLVGGLAAGAFTPPVVGRSGAEKFSKIRVKSLYFGNIFVLSLNRKERFVFQLP